MDKLMIPALVVTLFLSGLTLAADPPQTVNIAELRKAKLAAAKKTYELLLRNFTEGRRAATAERTYHWSRRWLEAERELNRKKEDQVAAYQAHRDRVRDLHRIVKDRFRERYVSVDEETAAEFYLLEAEIWLAKAREGELPTLSDPG
jgi:hypothetical protein